MLIPEAQHCPPQNRTPRLSSFCRYDLQAKCVIVAGTRRLAQVAATLAPENCPVCHCYYNTSMTYALLCFQKQQQLIHIHEIRRTCVPTIATDAQ